MSSTTRIAWIGNSFIYFNDLPTLVKELLQEAFARKHKLGHESGSEKDKPKRLEIQQAQVRTRCCCGHLWEHESFACTLVLQRKCVRAFVHVCVRAVVAISDHATL